VLKLRRVISVIDGENTRSLRVAERCGLRHGRAQIDVLGRLLHIYLWPL
jgi:RimJ/RimL family protein N-acetyltransferase